MSDEKQWIPFVPTFAPHVEGQYTRREYDDETGLPEPQLWKVVCKKCGGTWQGECHSGQVRVHINRFAVVHVHRDPLEAVKIVRPGSKRSGGA